MPCDFYCEACGLAFTVGWFHYGPASDEFYSDKEFSAATFLVCIACGTCHFMEHAIQGKVADKLISQRAPLILPSRPSESIRWDFKDAVTRDVPDVRPQRKAVEFIELEGISDELNLAEVECNYCHSKGALVSQFPQKFGDWEERVRIADEALFAGKPRAVATCPKCKALAIEIANAWMT